MAWLYIFSHKASISELETQLEEERDQRREERQKAVADLKVALQKVQSEAQEEIKRQSHAAAQRERELQEEINKLQVGKSFLILNVLIQCMCLIKSF